MTHQYAFWQRGPALALISLVALASGSSEAAGEATRLLPAETDLIVVVNVSKVFEDHRDTPIMQRYLAQWRLALKGNEKELRNYYHTHDLRKFEEIGEREFLERAATIKTICTALGLDPLTDIDRVTIGIQAKQGGFVAVVVEGRFEQAKVGAGMKGIMPAVRQWFGTEAEAAAAPGMMIFADTKRTLTDLQARLGKKNGAVARGVVPVAESGANEHVALIVNHCDEHAQVLARFLKSEVAPAMASDDPAGKLVIGQTASWLQRNADDFTAASIAMSLRDGAIRLQLGLDAKKPERAREVRSLAGNWGYWGGLGLRAVNDEFSKRAGDILMRTRVTGTGTTVIVHAELPRAFIEQLSRRAEFGLDSKASPIGAFLATRVTSIPLWRTAIAQDESSPNAIVATRAIAYRTGAGADSIRHRLDMYLPRNKKDYPVVVMVHGGAWDLGDNRSAGLYPSVAQFLASQGIGVVVPNYRLSPAVKHPEHVKDVANAVAWTKANIGKHGGDVRRLFLIGHSAGGHLVSLLATDDSYLRAEKLKLSDIRGVMAFSGVYRIPPSEVPGTLGGAGPRALRLEQMLPMRGDSGPSWTLVPPGIPLELDVFGPVFGPDAKARSQASPIAHVRRGLPPFRLFVAEHDLPTLSTQADEFHAVLRKSDCDAELIRMARRNHNSVLFSAITPQDPAAKAMLQFIHK